MELSIFKEGNCILGVSGRSVLGGPPEKKEHLAEREDAQISAPARVP